MLESSPFIIESLLFMFCDSEQTQHLARTTDRHSHKALNTTEVI